MGNAPRSKPPGPAARWCGGRCWVLLSDPCGFFCVALTYAFAACTAALVNAYSLLPRAEGPLSALNLVGYNCTVLAMLLAQLRCMLTDPGTARDHLDQDLVGVMRREYQRLRAAGGLEGRGAGGGGREPWLPGQRRKWWCTRCDTFRPRHTHHCSTCNCCVLEMDHHCPWVNNCVGWRNHKYFLQFMLYAWIACGWSVAAVVYAISHPPEMVWHLAPDSAVIIDDILLYNRLAAGGGRSPVGGPWWLPQLVAYTGQLHTSIGAQLGCILSCIVCVPLMVFVSVMCCDQWQYMSDGYGVIDKKQLQGRSEGAAAGEPQPAPRDAPGGGGAVAAKAPDEVDGARGAADAPAAVGELLRAPDGAPGKASKAGQRRRCCGAGPLGAKLPLIMGTTWPLGLGWLLPVAPGDRDLASVPEDSLIAAARQRLLAADGGDAAAPGAAAAAGEEGQPGAGNAAAQSATAPVAAGARRGDDGGLVPVPPQPRSESLQAPTQARPRRRFGDATAGAEDPSPSRNSAHLGSADVASGGSAGAAGGPADAPSARWAALRASAAKPSEFWPPADGGAWEQPWVLDSGEGSDSSTDDDSA